jgi:hypothetical protein
VPSGELKKSDLANNAILKPKRPGFESEIPEYTIKGFQYVSVQRGVKQWKIIADEAFFYEKKGVVTVREVHAEIYDERGRITIVESREGEYGLESRNLDLYREVESQFPDGFITNSEFTHYEAKSKLIDIPLDIEVLGHSTPEFGTDQMRFRSWGAIYDGITSKLHLLSRVFVEIESPQKDGSTEKTEITSDKSTIDRATNAGEFSMEPVKKGKPRLVFIEQPNLKCHSRRAKFNFSATERALEQMQVYEDVHIVEYPPKPDPNDVKALRNGTPSPRVATGGIAEFYAEKNMILLKQYPQVVQDHDTITGEVITIYRDKDQVEVETSNAYSERKESP